MFRHSWWQKLQSEASFAQALLFPLLQYCTPLLKQLFDINEHFIESLPSHGALLCYTCFQQEIEQKSYYNLEL